MSNVARILYAASIIEELMEKGYDVKDFIFNDDSIAIIYEGDGMEMILTINPKD